MSLTVYNGDEKVNTVRNPREVFLKGRVADAKEYLLKVANETDNYLFDDILVKGRKAGDVIFRVAKEKGGYMDEVELPQLAPKAETYFYVLVFTKTATRETKLLISGVNIDATRYEL